MKSQTQNHKAGILQGSLNPSPETEPPLPSVLFKYYAFSEWTQSIFEQHKIFFQSPDCFNDPFDSKISTIYEGTEEQRVSRLIELWQKGPAKGKKEDDLRSQAREVVKSGQDLSRIFGTVQRSQERIRKRIGIFCMTGKRDNILMWSHYADGHRGFCLEFSTTFKPFDLASPVRYNRVRPSRNLIESPDRDDTEQRKEVAQKLHESCRLLIPEWWAG